MTKFNVKPRNCSLHFVEVAPAVQCSGSPTTLFAHCCTFQPRWQLPSQPPSCPLNCLFWTEFIILRSVQCWGVDSISRSHCLCHFELTLKSCCGCNLKPNCLAHSHYEAPAPLLSCIQLAFLSTMHYSPALFVALCEFAPKLHNNNNS